MRVACFVPTRGYVWFQTARRMPGLFAEAFAEGHELSLDYVRGNIGVVHVRNLIMERFLDSGADVLMMVDDDVVLPENALSPLLEWLDVYGIVGAPCPMMQPGTVVLPNVYAWDEKSKTAAIDLLASQEHGMVEVAAVGFGAVCVRRDVCAKLKGFKVRTQGRHVTMGEDIDFCLRARSQGFKVGVHNEVSCEHMLNVHGNETAVSYASLITALTTRVKEEEDGFAAQGSLPTS